METWLIFIQGLIAVIVAFLAWMAYDERKKMRNANTGKWSIWGWFYLLGVLSIIILCGIACIVQINISHENRKTTEENKTALSDSKKSIDNLLKTNTQLLSSNEQLISLSKKATYADSVDRAAMQRSLDSCNERGKGFEIPRLINCHTPAVNPSIEDKGDHFRCDVYLCAANQAVPLDIQFRFIRYQENEIANASSWTIYAGFSDWGDGQKRYDLFIENVPHDKTIPKGNYLIVEVRYKNKEGMQQPIFRNAFELRIGLTKGDVTEVSSQKLKEIEAYLTKHKI